MYKLEKIVSKIMTDIKGQLDINLAVTAILGLILAASFLVIGIIVMQGVVDGSAIVSGDSFYFALDNVTNSITSAVVLGGTLLLVIVGVAILMMLASVMWIVRRVQ